MMRLDALLSRIGRLIRESVGPEASGEPRLDPPWADSVTPPPRRARRRTPHVVTFQAPSHPPDMLGFVVLVCGSCQRLAEIDYRQGDAAEVAALQEIVTATQYPHEIGGGA